MARKQTTTTQSPEVEVASAELENIEGKKNIVQNEVLSIADNRKRMEEDFENRKREIEDDLAIKTRNAEVETEKLSNQTVSLKDENDKLSQSNEELRGKNANLISENGSLEKDVETKRQELSKIKSEIVVLSDEKNELQKATNDLAPKLAGLKERFNILTKDVTALEARKKTAEDDHAAISASLESVTGSHDSLVVARDAKQKEVTDIDAQLKEKNETLSKVTKEIADFEVIIKHFREEMDKKTLELSERTKNATNLEVHVQEKLETLKELEKHFTNEHLARFGYKKTE